MRHINPTFYVDMMKVFNTERTPADSLRYISKLKNCEDTNIKSPISSRSVENDLNIEISKMTSLKKVLYLKSHFKSFINYQKKAFQPISTIKETNLNEQKEVINKIEESINDGIKPSIKEKENNNSDLIASSNDKAYKKIKILNKSKLKH